MLVYHSLAMKNMVPGLAELLMFEISSLVCHVRVWYSWEVGKHLGNDYIFMTTLAIQKLLGVEVLLLILWGSAILLSLQVIDGDWSSQLQDLSLRVLRRINNQQSEHVNQQVPYPIHVPDPTFGFLGGFWWWDYTLQSICSTMIPVGTSPEIFGEEMCGLAQRNCSWKQHSRAQPCCQPHEARRVYP